MLWGEGVGTGIKVASLTNQLVSIVFSLIIYFTYPRSNKMAATQLTSKARRPKNSWQMVTVKVLDTYQMNISYRNTRGESAPHSSSAKNVTAKVPYGPPISCEYRTRKDVQSGDHIKEFKFLNRRREGACFDETMLNNICKWIFL